MVRIFLTGYMGAGKTTLGKAFARYMNCLLYTSGTLILGKNATIDAPTFIFYMVILYSVINPLKDFAKAGYNIQMCIRDRLNSMDSESTNPIPVIYQSGYLTIKGYDERFGIYRLGFPNREVEEGFIRFLLPYYANVNKVESPFEMLKFVREVEAGDYESFFRRLQSFFSDIPYELARELELHYQNVLYIVCKLVGFYVKAEYHTSEGRVDMVLQTDKFIYIMEFKLNGTAEEALQQIEDKHYARPFATDSRKLFKIGVNFSAETRNIEKWLVEN